MHRYHHTLGTRSPGLWVYSATIRAIYVMIGALV